MLTFDLKESRTSHGLATSFFFNHVIQDYHLFLGVGEEITEQRHSDQTDHQRFPQIYASNFNIILFTLFFTFE